MCCSFLCMLIEQVNVRLKLMSGIEDKWLSCFFMGAGLLAFVYISHQHVQPVKYKEMCALKNLVELFKEHRKL